MKVAPTVLIDHELHQGTKLSASLVPVLNGKSVISRKSLLQVCNSYLGVTKLLINKKQALLQGTLPHDHIVDNKLPHLMPSKPPILVPRQVLCPVSSEGHVTGWFMWKSPFSIGKQTRKSHRKKIRSGKL